MKYTSKELKLLSDCLLDSLILKNRQLAADMSQVHIQPRIDEITKLLAKIDKQIIKGI